MATRDKATREGKTSDKGTTGAAEGALVRDAMTPQPAQLSVSATVAEAAQTMRDRNVGAILVTDEEGLCGMLTDRDIVVRGVADGKDPNRLKIGDICSHELWALAPTDPLTDAVQLMRNRSVRRAPVLENGKTAVGVISLGDLAVRLDPSSALGSISAARPNA